MRDAAHYRQLMTQSEDGQVGYALAAAAVYATLTGSCEASHHATPMFRRVARAIRSGWGESLTGADVLELMALATADSLAGRVRLWRGLRAWSQTQAATAAKLRQGHWSELETVTRDPHVSTLVQAAAALGCELADLAATTG